MNRESTWVERLRQKMDLPPDIIPVQMQIVMGLAEVSIYGHNGIAVYDTQQIRIRIRCGYAVVSGIGLEVSRMNRTRLQITGQIQGVELEAVT